MSSTEETNGVAAATENGGEPKPQTKVRCGPRRVPARRNRPPRGEVDFATLTLPRARKISRHPYASRSIGNDASPRPTLTSTALPRSSSRWTPRPRPPRDP